LSHEIREKLLGRIFEDNFVWQRQLDKCCHDLSGYWHIRNFFDVLCFIPIPPRVFGIMVGS
jgi:hypothetical protein